MIKGKPKEYGLKIVNIGGNVTYGVDVGSELTFSGFISTYGKWVSIPTTFALCCFAFSTILG